MKSFIQRNFLIPRLLSNFNRSRSKKAFITLREAQAIGILADLRKSGSIPPVVHFAKSVNKQEQRCQLLLIVPDKRKDLNPFNYERHFPGMPVELVCSDDINWIGYARKELINPFIYKPYDILFYLETEENFTLESVLYQCQARMFAGPEGLCNGVFDFAIGMQERTDLPYLSENLMKYLQTFQVKTDPPRPQTEGFKLF